MVRRSRVWAGEAAHDDVRLRQDVNELRRSEEAEDEDERRPRACERGIGLSAEDFTAHRACREGGGGLRTKEGEIKKGLGVLWQHAAAQVDECGRGEENLEASDVLRLRPGKRR